MHFSINIDKIVITIMRMIFKKHFLIERYYGDYKYFDQIKFKNDLMNDLNEKLSAVITNYESFETTFIEVLNK